MKAPISDFKIIDHVILESTITAHKGKEKDYEIVAERMKEKSFDIDFEIRENEGDSFSIEVLIKKNKPRDGGYSFRVRGFFLFELKDFYSLKEEVTNQYVFYTALPMAVNYIRYHIAHISTDGLFGRYILPSADLKALIKVWTKENTDKDAKKN